ncbi:MAG TPA: tetratricopeptide repeat protein [Rhodoferax sp.]|jgi:predicted negative regulator of RcsB-dependent stress response|nr:tetratricopeptide repeat protein [Rhodoferax sp.]HNV58537.1 tetratricopeptide repeat protein [Rhodoferax sp.]HPW28816.1 tetratricopeptide repeat protein [Rhodoferax sp.]
MANHLDLEEQEQLDELKHFWKQYGNLITWALIVVLGVVAAWNGYQLWQRNQSVQAAAMYDEVEKVVKGGDPAKADRAFWDMKDRFASALYTQQAGLLVAKMSQEAGKTDASKAILNWLVEHAGDKGYASVARLRLSALLIEANSYDEALKLLTTGVSPEFLALADDRKGDIYYLQGKKDEAKTEYLKAFRAFEEQTEYRRMVGVKLGSLGVDPLLVDKPKAVAEGTK